MPSSKNTFYVILSLLFAASTAAIILLCTLNYVGYCLAEAKFLSDDEKIKVAIEKVNGAKQIPVPRPSPIPFRDNYKYANTSEFMSKNPNCCKVYYTPYMDWVPPRSFFGRVFGSEAGRVLINYNARYLDDKKTIRLFKTTTVVNIQNCGQTN